MMVPPIVFPKCADPSGGGDGGLHDDDITTDSNTIYTEAIMTADGRCTQHPWIQLRKLDAYSGQVFLRDECPECTRQYVLCRGALRRRAMELDQKLQALEEEVSGGTVYSSDTETTTAGDVGTSRQYIPPLPLFPSQLGPTTDDGSCSHPHSPTTSSGAGFGRGLPREAPLSTNVPISPGGGNPCHPHALCAASVAANRHQQSELHQIGKAAAIMMPPPHQRQHFGADQQHSAFLLAEQLQVKDAELKSVRHTLADTQRRLHEEQVLAARLRASLEQAEAALRNQERQMRLLRSDRHRKDEETFQARQQLETIERKLDVMMDKKRQQMWGGDGIGDGSSNTSATRSSACDDSSKRDGSVDGASGKSPRRHHMEDVVREWIIGGRAAHAAGVDAQMEGSTEDQICRPLASIESQRVTSDIGVDTYNPQEQLVEPAEEEDEEDDDNAAAAVSSSSSIYTTGTEGVDTEEGKWDYDHDDKVDNCDDEDSTTSSGDGQSSADESGPWTKFLLAATAGQLSDEESLLPPPPRQAPPSDTPPAGNHNPQGPSKSTDERLVSDETTNGQKETLTQDSVDSDCQILPGAINGREGNAFMDDKMTKVNNGNDTLDNDPKFIGSINSNEGDGNDDDDLLSTGEATVASSTYGEDRQQVINRTLVDSHGDEGTYTGMVLKSTGMPHGMGRMDYTEVGRMYSGSWYVEERTFLRDASLL